MDQPKTSAADDRQYLAAEAAAREAQRLAPKIYTHKKKVISTTRAITIRVDQFGTTSHFRPHTVKPSTLTGWVITHVDTPITHATMTSTPKDMPEALTQSAEKTSATPNSSSSTIARRVYSIKHLEAIGKAVTGPRPSHATLLKMGLIECLKPLGKITRKTSDEERFVIVSKAELDNEDFDVVDCEGPSATNGVTKDPNSIGMDELASAFRSVWDTYK